MLLALLAVPWLAHAFVTGLSAVRLHPLSSRVVSSVLVGVSIAAGVVAARWGAGAGARSSAHALTGMSRHFATVLCGLAVAGLSLALLAAVALPLFAYDALGYHLPVIANWLDEGRVAWVNSDDPIRNGYPLGQEAIGALLVAATGSTRWVALPSFLYVAAGALSIWLFAEQIGVRRQIARASGALFALVPMVLLNAPTGYVDASFAGAAIAATLLLTSTFASAELDGRVPVAAGMAASHALSLKATGVSTLLAVCGASAVAAVVARRALAHRPEGLVRRSVVAAAFALPGTFWLLRNAVETGNPLWPVDVNVAGHNLLHGVAPLSTVIDFVHNTPAALAPLSEPARVAHTWFEVSGFAHAFDERMAGLGLAWPLVALPAIVFTVVSAAKGTLSGERRVALLVVFAATAIAFAVQPLRWWPRFTVWLWGAGAVAIAHSAEALIAARRERVVAAALAVLTCSALVEGGVAVVHANGLGRAVARDGLAALFAGDGRNAPNAAEWVDDSFWKSGVADAPHICRGAWKPDTDDANLDGVFAQLSPRPHVHVLADDDGDWSDVQRAAKDAGCTDLLLLRGSPVLPLAQKDPDVTVESAIAFDPLFVVRPRGIPQAATRNEIR